MGFVDDDDVVLGEYSLFCSHICSQQVGVHDNDIDCIRTISGHFGEAVVSAWALVTTRTFLAGDTYCAPAGRAWFEVELGSVTGRGRVAELDKFLDLVFVVCAGSSKRELCIV